MYGKRESTLIRTMFLPNSFVPAYDEVEDMTQTQTNLSL